MRVPLSQTFQLKTIVQIFCSQNILLLERNISFSHNIDTISSMEYSRTLTDVPVVTESKEEILHDGEQSTTAPSPYDDSWVQLSLNAISHIKSPSVLLVGEPALRILCEPICIDDIESEAFLEEKYRLHRALFDFRAANGFGRSIAAPQIGVNKRFLAINMGKGPFTLINPTITSRSDTLISLWDDCMSFPFILVRKQRHASVSVKFVDDNGKSHIWKNLDTATSELLQHELDHLDGILALDEPFGKNAVVSRDVYEKRKEYFDQQVDYVIEPTV